jgi:predicted amidohydrolase
MVNVGIVQMQSDPLAVERNLCAAERLIDEVAANGAQIVVLPEVFNVGFYFGEDLMSVSEDLDGNTVRWLKQKAFEKNIYITTSIYEAFEGHYYNTMVMIGNDGSVQYYRKRNPTWFETSVWRRSSEPGPGIFETPFGRVGGVICFDSFSRETYEGFKKSDVDIVIIVSCWGASKGKVWRPDVLLAYPALKKWAKLATEDVPNFYSTKLGVPTVLVNQGGKTDTSCQTPRFYPLPDLTRMRYDFSGRSSIRDATGAVLASASRDQVEYSTVVSIDIRKKEDRQEVSRIDLTNDYLSSDYYIVQPPLMAKIFQSYFFSGLQRVYDARRRKYRPANAARNAAATGE